MGKLSETMRGVLQRLKDMRKGMKIALGVSIAAIILAAVFLGFYTSSNKYDLLFGNMDKNDAKIVNDKLKEMKVDTKVKGNNIYVPKGQVEQLRLELSPEITNGSKGFELMDSGNSFGMTDEEFKLKKQRMLQGEIEKTIKSFPQIQNARVHITPAQESAFVRDAKPGKAAVYIQLKPSNKLSLEQVRSIVALVSGASQGIPKESVEVVDDKMNLLSRDIFKDENEQSVSSGSIEKQQDIEAAFERKLELALMDLLEPSIGNGKVKVKVNSDLDFDSKQKSVVIIDPNKVPVSEKILKETNTNNGDRLTQSPVDNNMNNGAVGNANNNSTSSKEETQTNYEVGKTESKTISAPGEVKRITASVIVDGTLDAASTQKIKNIVAGAIGYKQDRGDEISVESLPFDPELKAAAKKQLEEMQKQAEAERRMKLYRTIAIAGTALLAIIIIIIALRKKNKAKEQPLEEAVSLDVVIGDEIAAKDKIQYAPIDFEVNDEKSHIEKEIKKYAADKPEQVAEIIKSWLIEDER